MSQATKAVWADQSVPDLRDEVLAFLAGACVTRGQLMLAIGGPGAAGKSTFATDLMHAVQDAGAAACLLDIDCYLRDRAERALLQPPVSGYDPAAYRLADAARDIATLAGGQVVEIREYDKIAGTRRDPVTLRPAPILIVEGSMALQPAISDAAAIRIYLTADEKVLFANRRSREISFGFDDDYIREKYGKLLPDYEAHILPQAARANLGLRVDNRYRVIAVEFDNEEPAFQGLRRRIGG
jgi:uridine kinase